jgi:microcystin degradation protein MlrC
MKKILVGGFQHETNTFSPVLTTYDNFSIGSEWPGLARHEALLEVFKDECNIPISGIISQTNKLGFECIPGTWCAASPSGKVTKNTYEKIAAMLLEDIKNNPDIDGFLLDLHGAMVTEHLDDGEGDLLKRIRDITGDDLPIIIALDFHANLTDTMLKHATHMHIYKTYPHMDMFEIGQQCARTLNEIFNGNVFTHKALRHTEYMMALNAQCTLIDPFKSIYAALTQLEKETGAAISLAPGFALSDAECAGPGVAVYADSQQLADDTADKVIALLDSHKKEFTVKLYKSHDAIEYAKQHPQDKPIILADTQDNSGAGGTSDTMGVFRALVETQTTEAIVAMIIDPDAAQKAFDAGENAKIELTLGEKSDGCTGMPFTGEFIVKSLSDEVFDATPGSYYEGCHIDIGPTAYVECEGVGAILACRKMQAADRALFTHLGVNPETFNILVLKSSVHFRADFMRMSDEILIVKSPGKAIADLTELTYEKCQKEAL